MGVCLNVPLARYLATSLWRSLCAEQSLETLWDACCVTRIASFNLIGLSLSRDLDLELSNDDASVLLQLPRTEVDVECEAGRVCHLQEAPSGDAL